MPWDPVRDLLGMQERLETLFGRTAPGWVPPVDLAEVADGYRLTVELPGMQREDVQIEFANDALTVRGHRPAESCPERYQQFERGQGEFRRSFRFAHPIASDAILADMADGVLTIVVPKAVPKAVDVEPGRRIAVE
jgi:HSP20 family protein